jgi:hypothetical protein
MLSSRNEDNSSRTIGTYLGLVAITVLAKIIFILTRLDHPLVKQGVFSWIGIIVISALGFIAVVLAPRAGFPDMWNGKVSNRQRFTIPMLVGAGLAMIGVVMDAFSVLPETPTVDFPFSIPAYLAGGILSEILLHLIPVVLLMWIIGAVILRGKWQLQVFWVVAVVISLLEPVLQIGGLYQMGLLSNAVIAAVLFAYIFAVNLTLICFLRKYGFLAAIVSRLAIYLIWHIIWPVIS